MLNKSMVLLLSLFIITVEALAEESTLSIQQKLDQQQTEIDALRLELESLKKQKDDPASPTDTLPAEEVDKKFLLRKTPNGEMTLSGRIHRVIRGPLC
jgi:hypothetical protein